MKHILLSAAVLGLLATGCQQNPKPSSQDNLEQIEKQQADTALLTGPNNSFADQAAIGGMLELESSAHMIKHTENRDVQQLATMMVKDHGMANKELMQLAKNENISLPQSLPAEKLAVIKTLDSLKEDERNHYYAELMVKEHKDAVKLFRTAAQSETNIKLKAFAESKVGRLEHHLLEAEKLLKTMQLIRNDKGDVPLKISQGSTGAH